MFENTDFTWLDNNIVLLAYGGSIAYGTANENSDTDIRGVCIPIDDYYYGLGKFDSYHSPDGSNPDIVVHSIKQYAKLILKNDPNAVEILFTEPERHIIWTEFGRRLIDIRYDILSKEFCRRAIGFARNQYECLLREGKPNHGQGSPERIADKKKHGYDTKAMSHLIRIICEAIEVLETCNLSVYRPERDLLVDIKNGKMSLDYGLKLYNEYSSKLFDLYIKSELRDKPDYNIINNTIIEITREYFKRK
jgi:predicted nucleotidyltransferase